MFWLGIWDKQATDDVTGIPRLLAGRAPEYEHDGPRFRIMVHHAGPRAAAVPEDRGGALPSRGETGKPGEFQVGPWTSPSGVEPGTAVVVKVNIETQAVEIAVPMTSLDSVCCRRTRGFFAVSTDPRLLYRPGMTPDPRALYSLLQFGAITPPFGPWREVSRLAPGIRHTLAFDDPEPRESGLVQPWPLLPPGTVTAGERERLIDRVIAVLDATLVGALSGRAPMILFSGGVDSGLLASRAAALGWRETRLLHYSFGPDDGETKVARGVAKHLGLSLEVVEDPVEPLSDLLANLGREYAVPFGDHSTIPTHGLVRHALQRLGGDGVVINGVGADGDFGLYDRYQRWNRIYQLPMWLRRMLAGLYLPVGVWRRESRLEVMLRLMRRSVSMPIEMASIAQNPLHGALYQFDAGDVEQVLSGFSWWLRRVLPEMDPAGRLCAADVMLTCAGMFAQKDRSLYDAAQRSVVFPFLEPQVFQLAVGEVRRGFSGLEAKSVLKRALARGVPPHLVYREKSGFTAPMQQRFTNPALTSALEEIVSGQGVIGPYAMKGRLMTATQDLRLGRRTHAQMHNLTWTMVFAHLWYRQVHELAAG